MSEIMDDIAYLSQEIGPRPAGTEEEQQAAIYISDTLKKRTGFETVIEDFACNPKPDLVKVILCVIAIILSIAAMIKNIVIIPAILVGILCALFFALEATGRPLLSRVLRRGVSQNVVSKYKPVGTTSRRSRKVILVASYDSGKIQREYGAVKALPFINTASLVAMVAIPVIWILRAAFAMEASGSTLIAWNVVTAVVLLLAAIPVFIFTMHQFAQYNEAANCNAASIAAMIEVARRVANTPMSADGASAQIHGEQAAREEGLIPEGAEIAYNVAPVEAVSAPESDSLERADAPADPEPIQPIEAEEQAEQPRESFVYLDDQIGWPDEYSFTAEGDASESAEGAQDAAEAVDPSLPEWYVKAQAKANRPADNGAPVRRSRFASALDQAVETSHQRAQEAAAAERAAREAALASAYEAARIASRPVRAKRDEFSQTVSEERVEVSAEEVQDLIDQIPEDPNPIVSDQPVEVEAVEQVEPEAEKPSFVRYASLAELAQKAIDDAISRGEDPSTWVRQPEPEPAPVQEEAFAQPAVDDALEAAVEDTQEEEAVSAGGTVAIPVIDVDQLRREMNQARSEQPEPEADEDPVSSDAFAADEEPQVQQRASIISQLDIPELPELDTDLPQIDSSYQQRAPLAESSSDPSLSSRIPRVNLDAFGISTAGNAEPMDNKRAALRNMIPSLSGSISFEDQDSEPEQSTVSRTGSFSPVGMSGSIGPVGDELIEGVAPEEIYIDDVDDSDYATNMTESGAYAGPGYVEMPESRASRFFGRFRRKKKEEVSAREWLDVDEDFNPTKVGAERGGWESFNEENRGRFQSKRNREDDVRNAWDDDDWTGGAFSKMRAAASKVVKKGDSAPADEAPAFDEAAPEQPEFAQDAPIQEPADIVTDEAASQESAQPAVMTLASFASQLADIEESDAVAEEVAQIEDFHLKNVDVEVWFVALGSENAANGGTRAFFEEHADELRGALIVNLEGLGAGAFSQVSTEGTFGAKVASPRLKRLVRKAQKVTGVTFTDASIRWKDSIASLALKKGLNAVTLAGIEKGKPAYIAQGDDVIENVDEEMLHRRIEFIEALVRHA